MKLNVNGTNHEVDVEANMPLLWVLRDELNMTGTKYGCGVSQCGACTVHINGTAVRSCIMPIGAVQGTVTTIEGLSSEDTLHAVQQAWVDQQVAQCGYCQSGQIMAAVDLLKRIAAPTDEQINQGMSGNLCRCGTYPRIKAAVKQASDSLNKTRAELQSDADDGSTDTNDSNAKESN